MIFVVVQGAADARGVGDGRQVAVGVVLEFGVAAPRIGHLPDQRFDLGRMVGVIGEGGLVAGGIGDGRQAHVAVGVVGEFEGVAGRVDLLGQEVSQRPGDAVGGLLGVLVPGTVRVVEHVVLRVLTLGRDIFEDCLGVVLGHVQFVLPSTTSAAEHPQLRPVVFDVRTPRAMPFPPHAEHQRVEGVEAVLGPGPGLVQQSERDLRPARRLVAQRLVFDPEDQGRLRHLPERQTPASAPGITAQVLATPRR